jgi:uncharacterized MnhB-related membrane protein
MLCDPATHEAGGDQGQVIRTLTFSGTLSPLASNVETMMWAARPRPNGPAVVALAEALIGATFTGLAIGMQFCAIDLCQDNW